MTKPRTNSKCVHCLLPLMTLVFRSAVVWGGPAQGGSTQDAELRFPRLLPRSPLATQGEKGEREKKKMGRAHTTAKGPTRQSSAEVYNGQRATDDEKSTIDNGYDGPRTTDDGSALTIPSSVIWERALQALGIQDAEFTFASLLSQSPFSPPLLVTQGEESERKTWEGDEPNSQGEKGKREKGEVDRGLTSPQSTVDGPERSNRPPTTDNERSSIDNRQSTLDNRYDGKSAIQDAESTFPSLLPRSPLVTQREKDKGEMGRGPTSPRSTVDSPERYNQPPTTDNGLSAIDNGYDGRRTTNQASALPIPSTLIGERALQALGIQDAESTFPSLLPQSPWLQAVEARSWDPEARSRYPSMPAARRLSTAGPAADYGQAPVVASTLVWRWVWQAIADLDAELRFPNLPPRSPLARQGEKGKREKGEMGPGQNTVKSPTSRGQAEVYNGQPTTDDGQSAIDNRQSTIGTRHDGPTTADHGMNAIDIRQSKIDNRYSATVSRIGVGLRDPFKLPPPPRPAVEENDPKFARNRPPGSRGLLIAQLRLKGVVRDGATHKMIAVVTNSNNRAYFLREGEAVYDGVVTKIAPDAVYFKENKFDAKREVHPREVVKNLNAATGEVQ